MNNSVIEINDKRLEQLQKHIHEDIPLTKDMGLKLIQLNNQKLQLSAPLSNNINDKGSVFGGSSAACMIISGWCLIKLYCDKNKIDADIVIHRNETKWIKASYQELLIEAQFNRTHDFKKIKDKISRGKHQRINCTIKMIDQNQGSFTDMDASFVILPKNTSAK